MDIIFKKLIYSFLALLLIWFIAPYFWHTFYNTEQLNLLSWHGYESYINVNGPIPYIYIALYIFAAFGLLYMHKWARTLFLALTLLSAVPVWGFIISPPIEGGIGFLSAVIQGAILAMAYLTSVSNQLK